MFWVLLLLRFVFDFSYLLLFCNLGVISCFYSFWARILLIPCQSGDFRLSVNLALLFSKTLPGESEIMVAAMNSFALESVISTQHEPDERGMTEKHKRKNSYATRAKIQYGKVEYCVATS